MNSHLEGSFEQHALLKVTRSCTQERRGRGWKEAICLEALHPLKSNLVQTCWDVPSPHPSSTPGLRVRTPIWSREHPLPASQGACWVAPRAASLGKEPQWSQRLTQRGPESAKARGWGVQTAPTDPTGSSQHDSLGRGDVQVGPRSPRHLPPTPVHQRNCFLSST